MISLEKTGYVVDRTLTFKNSLTLSVRDLTYFVMQQIKIQ